MGNAGNESPPPSEARRVWIGGPFGEIVQRLPLRMALAVGLARIYVDLGYLCLERLTRFGDKGCKAAAAARCSVIARAIESFKSVLSLLEVPYCKEKDISFTLRWIIYRACTGLSRAYLEWRSIRLTQYGVRARNSGGDSGVGERTGLSDHALRYANIALGLFPESSEAYRLLGEGFLAKAYDEGGLRFIEGAAIAFRIANELSQGNPLYSCAVKDQGVESG